MNDTVRDEHSGKDRERTWKEEINTVNDLVMYFPRKYLDYRKIVPLMEAVDRDCAISGYLESYEKQTDKNMTIIKAHLIEESSGQKVTITWIGQSYQYNAIKNFARKEIVVCGKVNITLSTAIR